MTYQVALTATGAAKLAAGIVNLTHMALGDGGGSEYDPDGTEIALVNEVYRQPLSAYNVTANKVIMQLSVPITDGGFHIREAGVFDTDGDMIYIANLATRYKPLPAEGGASDLSITLVTTVSNIANLTVTVDGTAYITQTVLTAELANKIDKVDDKATAAEAEAATDTDKFMTPETTYAAYGASDPVVLTTSPHNQLITESILTGSAASMVINLADVATYPKSKLNRIALTIANLSNKNWTITPAAGSGASSETLSITGSTTTPPTYALDATSLPTVTNGTIASNLFTATANNASAQTFDYVAGGTVESITPQMKFVPGTVLTVDPASTTGSTKFNYSASNTVQVGSKLLVDVGGTVSEITVAAGSQASVSVFDSGWGQLSYANLEDGSLIAVGTSNRKLARSTDGGTSWTFLATLGGTGAISGIAGACYFLGKAYIGLIYSTNQSTINLWSSSDWTTWTSAHSQTFTNAGSCGVATNGAVLSVLYGTYNAPGFGTQDIRPFSSTDGMIFTVRTEQSFIEDGTGNSAVLLEHRYSNGQFISACYRGALSSPDGINFTKYQATVSQLIISIDYFNSLYIIARQDNYSTFAIYSSSDLTTWILRQTAAGATYWGRILVSSGLLTLPVYNSTTVYTSANGTTWSNNTATGAAFSAYSGAYNNGQFIYGKISTREMWISSTGTSGWTDVNPDAATYQFTMTSPSIVVPAWAGLGGQTEQFSVSATSTPSFVAATIPAYTRSGNVITAMYAQVTGQSGTHVQLKALTLNSGDALSQIGATLEAGTLQTINGKTGLILAPGKVAMLTPTADGWLSDRDNVTGKVITTNYTMTAADDIVVLGANNLTATLPDATAVEPWKVYKVKAGDFTGGIIATQSGQTVDGTTPPTLNALDSLNVYSNGANWLID